MTKLKISFLIMVKSVKYINKSCPANCRFLSALFDFYASGDNVDSSEWSCWVNSLTHELNGQSHWLFGPGHGS